MLHETSVNARYTHTHTHVCVCVCVRLQSRTEATIPTRRRFTATPYVSIRQHTSASTIPTRRRLTATAVKPSRGESSIDNTTSPISIAPCNCATPPSCVFLVLRWHIYHCLCKMMATNIQLTHTSYHSHRLHACVFTCANLNAHDRQPTRLAFRICDNHFSKSNV